MTVLLSIVIGVLAGVAVLGASLTGSHGRPNTLRAFLALALAIPLLVWWAQCTDQFPATFGSLAVVEAGGLNHLRRRASRSSNG